MRKKHTILNSEQSNQKKRKSCGSLERKTKRIKILAKVKEDENEVMQFLDRNDAEGAILYLKAIENYLEEFLKATNYQVFDWAIEHRNMSLLNHLFSKVRPEYHFLMTSHDGYAAIERFINNILGMSTTEYSAASNQIYDIFKQIGDIDLKFIDIIENKINKKDKNNLSRLNGIYNDLKEDINVKKNLEGNSLPENTAILFSHPKPSTKTKIVRFQNKTSYDQNF